MFKILTKMWEKDMKIERVGSVSLVLCGGEDMNRKSIKKWVIERLMNNWVNDLNCMNLFDVITFNI